MHCRLSVTQAEHCLGNSHAADAVEVESQVRAVAAADRVQPRPPDFADQERRHPAIAGPDFGASADGVQHSERSRSGAD